MYQITEDFANMIGRLKTSYISENIGMSLAYVSSILNGKQCSEIVARALLSLYFDIAINDEQMNGLIEKKFTKIKD